MKKSLLYLFALICSVSLFTACSDDEDNSWQELPQGEIKPEKVDLQLNGQSTTGTIDFKAISLEAAEVGIKNVIDGYSDVTVDVKMDKQADGSFKLSGTKEIMTKPVTRATNTPTPMLKVTVDGTIALDGKLTVNVSATGAGLYIGTYSGKTLVLSYSDAALTGKEVVFDGTTGDNVSLLLTDVIPGEKETAITGIQVSNDGFSGTATTTTAEVKYTGTRKDKVLTLKLDVTMKDPSKWAKTYGLSAYETGPWEYEGSAMSNWVFGSSLYSNWKSTDSYVDIMSGIFKTMGGALLPQILKSITLEPNGNVSAEYSSGSIVFEQDWIINTWILGSAPTAEEINKLIPTTGWQKSPKNLAYWYEKGGKMYLKLNVATIVSQELGSDGDALSGIISQILNGDAATIKKLLGTLLKVDLSNVTDATFNTLLSWVNEGFPMDVKTVDGHTYMSLDKTAFDPILTVRTVKDADGNDMVDPDFGTPIITSDLQELWTALSKANVLPPEAQAAGALLEIISPLWAETTEFDLGLDLQAK